MNTATIFSLVQSIAQSLAPSYNNVELCTQYAWWMLEAISGLSRTELIAQKTISLSQAQQETLQSWIHQQVTSHIPLSYLIGSVPFLDLTITIRPPILIPRPETEEWCAQFIAEHTAYKNSPLKILDLCTGSGCVALSMAAAFKHAQVYAVDISHAALSLAQENTERNNIHNVTFVHSDLYSALNKNVQFDVILANPPYISKDEWQHLDPSVKEWEDYQALVADDNGLAIIRKIINEADLWINPASPIQLLIIEIGYLQADAVAALMHDAGLCNVAIVADSAGKPRIARGRVCNAKKTRSY